MIAEQDRPVARSHGIPALPANRISGSCPDFEWVCPDVFTQIAPMFHSINQYFSNKQDSM
jgi:hypothetical protein